MRDLRPAFNGCLAEPGLSVIAWRVALQRSPPPLHRNSTEWIRHLAPLLFLAISALRRSQSLRIPALIKLLRRLLGTERFFRTIQELLWGKLMLWQIISPCYPLSSRGRNYLTSRIEHEKKTAVTSRKPRNVTKERHDDKTWRGKLDVEGVAFLDAYRIAKSTRRPFPSLDSKSKAELLRVIRKTDWSKKDVEIRFAALSHSFQSFDGLCFRSSDRMGVTC